MFNPETIHLSRIHIQGYKSIADADITLHRINILIGANGAGKSNFISALKFIQETEKENIDDITQIMGGANRIVHFGRKKTETMKTTCYFQSNNLFRTIDFRIDNNDHFFIKKQTVLNDLVSDDFLMPNHIITRLWRVYHFHDTSNSAPLKQTQNLHDNEYLREDGRNLAAFLYRLRHSHEKHYRRIVKTIQQVAPFFGDFHLRPNALNPETIRLEWTEKGYDEPFGASALSDGTLRFMCLATALLQPSTFMPPTILIDEPELGLHPFAIQILAGLIRSASQQNQIIISTQSVELLNLFTIDDVIVVDKIHGASTFTRPDHAQLTAWLDEYSLGELWNKNLLGGRPK